MLTDKQLEAIKAPFPPEALSADLSRGFELTSIKAAYVIERLNEIFGPCGIGWRYVHSPFEEVRINDGRTEILTEVAFQYHYNTNEDCTGCNPIVWDAQSQGWAYRSGGSGGWSEPIFAAGGKVIGKGGAPHTDGRKSATTDAITKAASLLGIGHEVFKGLIRVGGNNGRVRTSDNGKPDSTAFWNIYHSEAKAVGLPIEAAKGLAEKGDWETAISDLRALIAAAKS